MKVWLCKQILICMFLVLLLIPSAVYGENITTSSIKIDGHWIYIFQLDDLNTFEVNEYLHINNTGETTFNDTFKIWIQNNSNIASDCCNYISNMACRYNATGEKECFFLNKFDDTNLYFGYPILSEDRLSYYGQKEFIKITAYSITNPFLENDTLHLNATIGGKSISREQKNFQDNGIHLTSENLDIGMQPIIGLYMLYHIMTIENLTIFNKGIDTEVIGFIINELPQGWAAEIWNDTEKLNNISLSPQEFANLTLVITAPSNIASIYVRYITQINTEGDEVKDIFLKKYLYETTIVSYEVYLSSIDELDVSNDLIMVHDEIFWIEDYERYWFIARSNDVQPNSNTTISIKFEKTDDSQLNPFSIVILIFIIFLIITILLLKRVGFFKEKEVLQKRENYLDNRIKELQEQKKKILSAIKRVEQEFKEEIISKEDYEQLRAAYKKRAVKILKEIDRLKK